MEEQAPSSLLSCSPTSPIWLKVPQDRLCHKKQTGLRPPQLLVFTSISAPISGDMSRYNVYHIDSAIHKLKIVSHYAIKKDKLAALTETGLESSLNPTWWTETLFKVMKTAGLQLSNVIVWCNDVASPTHYYATLPGHSILPDFTNF